MKEKAPVRPFLKWAGGKTQLLRPIAERLPASIPGTYFEPFLGSGAVFFHLWATGRIQGKAVLSDANGALVGTWIAVRDEVDALIARLADHRDAHERRGRDHYYETRAAEPATAVERAARFLYLNKTCYNGLWRVNASGKFNVPMGTYRKPPILDEPNLRAASAALQGVEILEASFKTVLARGRRNAVAYLDPPYEPLTATANFTSYTAAGFGREDQVALADACVALRDRGGSFLLSNHDTRPLRALYRARGFAVSSVAARRAINSNPTARGNVRELLVTPASSRP